MVHIAGMMRRTMQASLCALLLAGQVQAQDENLKLHFDFTSVEGTTVKDNVTGVAAKTVGSASVKSIGKYKVLDLGDANGYLDMTQEAGKVAKALGDFTVSVYYRVNVEASLAGAGHFLWCFSQSAANTQTASPYMAYRLNAQRMATSTGGWGSESGLEVGSESEKGRWIHMLYRQAEKRGELFIDGTCVKTNAAMPVPKETFTATPAYCWIGRPPFSADSYLKQTLVADFRLYDAALSDEAIAQLAAVTADLEQEFLYGGGGDNTALLKAVDEATKLLSNTKEYPQGAVLMLQDAITIARNVAMNDCNQTTYDTYEKSLRTTMASYRAAKGVTFDVSGITDVYDTERGFRHPGGLHTQADFDRIKRQLAEGHPLVTEAYNRLKSAEYSQSTIQTYPVETIVRGGTGQNYINAARGATMAYQNALRWKIKGTEANAKAAVRILMAWAKTCKLVSGDSNWALAAGLYGYEFAQAAELMRDYEGWKREDFDTFKRWMLTVWYPGNINFLRGRNGTWENWVGNQGGIRPGHYWSNWPLCNALAVISIGILCDDVFIYNQGMSFMKYDQVGTFVDPRTANPILSDGCTEFIGNLIVTTTESPLETGAYGKLGQMQESGRDGGHAAMALGLAVDICKVAWNQGDDLFSYMDNRMAAGIEFVAACTQNVKGLPWTNYKYVDCRTAWHNGWLMTGPAEPAEVRNYWGTVIGHYEGVKGVEMPFAKQAYNAMIANGPDVGGTGGSSGPYDHLGYSVLTNTYDEQLCPEEKRPTLLTPKMRYDGKEILHNELGGLKNTYIVASTECVPTGKQVTLMPQLPEGEEDSGQWLWNTGATTRDITVDTDRSYLYRVTYTNTRGVQSEQVFSIAVEGDCTPSPTNYSIYVDGTYMGDTVATLFYGDELTLNAGDAAGWNPRTVWDNGTVGASASYGNIASERTIQAYVTNQGGRRERVNFHIRLRYSQPNIICNGTTLEDTTHIIAQAGDRIILQPYVPAAAGEVSYQWSDGSTSPTLTIESLAASGIYTVTVTIGDRVESYTYEVLTPSTTAEPIAPGIYMVRHHATDTYLTCHGKGTTATFMPGDSITPADNQRWIIATKGKGYSLTVLSDSLALSSTGKMTSTAVIPLYLPNAVGVNRYALHSGTGASAKYWDADAEGNVLIEGKNAIDSYPFELLLIEATTDIAPTTGVPHGESTYYDLMGRKVEHPTQGIYIKEGMKVVFRKE